MSASAAGAGVLVAAGVLAALLALAPERPSTGERITDAVLAVVAAVAFGLAAAGAV